METEIISGLIGILIGWGLPFLQRRSPKVLKHGTSIVTKAIMGTSESCAVCGNTPNQSRFHDGRWLCSKCKSA